MCSQVESILTSSKNADLIYSASSYDHRQSKRCARHAAYNEADSSYPGGFHFLASASVVRPGGTSPVDTIHSHSPVLPEPLHHSSLLSNRPDKTLDGPRQYPFVYS
jgi:hypothetical protein